MSEVRNSERIEMFHSFDNVVEKSNYIGNITRYFFKLVLLGTITKVVRRETRQRKTR